jgi:alanyl-tRNA synthetase
LKSREIRQKFLDFFKEREHKIVPSAPVVPYEDPTLLFTNAGMNQFKDVFLATGTRDYTRAADTQKCIRAGGKHNDLEEVGMDGYHHTFFEMLGNWSFGDYYKKEAIKWAWELLTDVYKLPKERLYATVYKTDDEAMELWKTQTDIAHDHILKFDEADNFWEMGETGPCGPCSEIHIDMTENGCNPEDVNAGLEDVIEIWNLVFIQYNRNDKGELEPLPKKHIDTGMGFERLVRVLQGKKSNYETDIFSPIINRISEITGKPYEGGNISNMNAVADHIRSLVFAISDGAIPSNEGRGYVLRRILRRAARLARNLGALEPIMYKLVDTVVENFGDVFPEIVDKKDIVKNVVKSEEESFGVTLDRGIKLFNETADSLIKSGEKTFPGSDAFKLYDTFGFPVDLTEVMARERGLTVDTAGFDAEMKKQKERARNARKEDSQLAEVNLAQEEPLINNKRLRYDPYDVPEQGVETKIVQVNKSDKSDIEALVLEINPFFSESGGQVSDTGKIILSDGTPLEVIDTKNTYYIYVKNRDGIKPDTSVHAIVDYNRRKAIQRNHSATHLMHEALKRVLGTHIKQMGSLVSDEYLRFDFPHFKKLEPSQVREIEDMVNTKIAEEIDVNTFVDMPIEEANKIPNAKKFFGEKYGDRVRVVIIDENFSVEFCGGTHVINTNDIGLFKIVKEESISSGTRRIFARTGEGIIKLIDEKVADIDKLLTELPEKYYNNFNVAISNFKKDFKGADFRDAELMKKLLEYHSSTIGSLTELRAKYLEEKKQQEKQLMKQNLEKAFAELENLIAAADKSAGFDIVSAKMDLGSMDELKEIGDKLREKLRNGVGLIAAVIDNKINLVCAVSDNLVKDKQLSAGKLISEVARELGGGGGGKPHLATAGAKDVSKLDEVLKDFAERVKGKL